MTSFIIFQPFSAQTTGKTLITLGSRLDFFLRRGNISAAGTWPSNRSQAAFFSANQVQRET